METFPSPSKYRSITNATSPEHIPSLFSLSSTTKIPAKSGHWHPSLVHYSGEVKFTVITVPPGKEVPSDHHWAMWDYFIHMHGSGIIEIDKGKEAKAVNAGAFLAVPPGVVHRVRNAASQKPTGKEDFVFLLTQIPRGRYDFLDDALPADGGSEK